MDTRAHHFRRDGLRRQPWKNGAGTTRDIACHPAGATMSDFDWRVSIADITQDAPFSEFPGVDRVITLLDGPGLRLQGPAGSRGGIDHRLDRRWQPWAFDGALALRATVLGGASEDLNVMTRRGRCQAHVRLVRERLDLGGLAAGMLLAVEGRWNVPANLHAPGRLGAGEGLWWDSPLPAGQALPASGDAALVLAEIRPAG